ncbi:B-box zinc finger protein 22 [Cynara cardunculus var. scolymus]|uniref:Zinc finger, B-box n=1 Tax=Cynara cardunculus var. scolymus TaxID=59895 RepID=A0A103Y421_CYNCS|nr:B-box zinc finger protein 22 [Cynara cardunculus var. scolymus]KVI02136.1 Zinc finger, B-box [Cynara cardunculus var. scolymus]
MKIQCNVCEAAEATVLCCADEAALCWTCDEKVHAANKLASKHQRVPLSTSNTQMPKCDICQEAVGYFFCLEDRALFCRKCDVAIHTVNSLVSSHQRFLLTGVKVGLEAADPGVSSSTGKSHSCDKIPEAEKLQSLQGRSVPMSATSQFNKVMPVQAAGTVDFLFPKMPFAGGSSAESIQQWQFDDFLGLSDFSQSYNYIDNGSSKADSGKFGESDGSPILRDMEVELDGEDCLGQVPDSSWAVPQISSPPTASGLCWPKDLPHHQHQIDSAAFVPDVCYLPVPNFYGSQQNTGTLKRRRHL